MRKILITAALLGAAILPGCRKKSQDNTTTPVIRNISDIKVPNGFTWESSHNVDFNVSITDARFGSSLFAIAVYDGDPYAGGNLIAKGSASMSAPYTNRLYLSKELTTVYVVKTAPDGSRIISRASATGSTVAMSFGATDPTVAFRPEQKSAAKTTTDCSSGCTSTITSNTTNVNVSAGNVICITGSGITVSFSSVTGGTIRVCGTGVTLSSLNLNGSATLLVTSSGSATLTGFNFNSSSATVQNDGILNGSFADAGIFTNNGTYNSSGDFNINSGAGTFINNGTMNISGSFNNSGSATATNNASINVSGNFQQNSGAGNFVNNCSLIISGNYNQSALVKNYNLVKVTGTTTINSGVELGLYNGSMLKTAGFMLNGTVHGYGSTSLLKITGSSVTINSGAYITAAVQVCTSASIDASKLTSGAATGCSLYIAVTTCNSEGNGTSAPTDTDGDGVADAADDYPTDATKAHNNYYPSSTGMATAAFEDQWPYKGDFDLNDVVIGYRYNVVTNASNVVVQVNGNYTLYATGGNYGNGFGVQFPNTYSSVSGLTGGTLESGQSKAVVILFTNMRSEMAQWNTVPGVTQTTPKTYAISFNVSGSTTISTFGLNGYNPFIWNTGLGDTRGREIHLSGHAPTDLVNTAYFGTHDDSTVVSAGRYYLTKTGLPYAIEVPIAPFSYPVEDTDITHAYLHFGAWAQSNGTTYTDWYSNTATGYRNTSLIYTY